MNSGEVYGKRWLLNETHGIAFLTDAVAQRELGFAWNGETIVDDITAFEYFFPSAIGSALFYHGSFEAGEIAVARAALSSIADPVVLDVGANIGLHALAFATANPNARIFAFEPVEANRVLLARNAERARVSDRIVVSDCAVSSTTGTAEIFECQDAAYSTIGGQAAAQVRARYEVPTIAVDEFVAKRSIDRVDFIKIDVEGEEFAVLSGAMHVLNRDKPFLLVEVSESLATNNASIDLLEGMGYSSFLITDGVVTARSEYVGQGANYFFVPPNSEFVPASDASIAHAEAVYRRAVMQRERRQLVDLRATLGERDEQIARLRNSTPSIERLRGEVERQHQAATERLAIIEDLNVRLGRLRAAVEERSGVIERQQAGLVARDARIVELEFLAQERLELIEAMKRGSGV